MILYKENKVYERAQQNINSFDKLYEKCLHESVIDIKEYENLSNNSQIMWMNFRMLLY